MSTLSTVTTDLPEPETLAPIKVAIKVAITLEATQAGPAIAAILARVLHDLGADVTLPDGATVPGGDPVRSLEGLEVEFVRTVWVVDREKMTSDADRKRREFFDILLHSDAPFADRHGD